jgi:hypothetical protein
MLNVSFSPTAATKPSPGDLAIDRCHRAWAAAYKAEFALSKSKTVAFRIAAEAYRNAMPPLFNSDSIRVLIACITHGLLIGVIDETKSSRLLYAARIASHSFDYTKTGRTLSQPIECATQTSAMQSD